MQALHGFLAFLALWFSARNLIAAAVILEICVELCDARANVNSDVHY
jgi:hypothetical protein